MENRYFEIIPATSLPRDKDKTFTYFFDKPLEKGAEVLIPFRNRILKGVVSSASKKPKFQIKKIIKIVDEKALNDNQFKLIDFMAERFADSKSLLAKIFLPLRPKKEIKKEYGAALKNAASLILPRSPLRNLLLIALTKKRLEIYKKILTESHKKNETALFLCPDLISLFKIFNWAKTFLPEEKIGFIYRGLSPAEYFRLWQKIKKGRIKIIFGLRSTVLLNFPALHLIIADDASNESYFQKDQKPYYDALEIISFFSKIYGARIILGSPLPRTENYFQARKEKWHIRNFLPQKISPKVINMEDEFQKKNFVISDAIQKKIQGLENKKALLLINRRGKARSLICRDCDFVFKCISCDLPLVLHSEEGIDKEITCHTCGYSESSPAFCPKCGGPRIKYRGIGSEKVEQEIKKLFPKIKISRFDQESLKGFSFEEATRKFQEKNTQILIGTPLILKPLFLPKIAFSGIISLDQNLLIPEFRNQEKTIRTFLKTIEISPEIFIQTRFPEHPIFKILNNFNLEKFYKKEFEERKIFNYPPFSHIAKIVIKEKTKRKAAAKTNGLKKKLLNAIKKEKITTLEVLGPISPLKPQKKGKYYSELIIRGSLSKIQKIIKKVPGNINIQIDPESLL